MTNLITITKRKGIETVSARELHEKLEVTERFNSWFERMLKYGFEENKDFTSVKSFTVVNNGARKVINEFFISLDMAKEICMLQRSDIGKEFRQYFIEIEKRYNEKQTIEYKKTRQKSIEVRNTFTDTLKNRGYDKPYEYINTTKAMKKPLGITAKKSDMTSSELKKITASEYLAEAMLDNEFGYDKVNPVCVDASLIVASALENHQKKLLA